MKKLLFITIFSVLADTALFAQVDTFKVKLSSHELAEQLLARSKKQRTTGWILLASGLTLEAIAIATYPKDYDFIFGGTSEQENNAVFSSLLFVAGTALWVSSIPTLISGRVNKRKANLLLKADNVMLTPAIKTNEWQFRTGVVIHF